MFDNMSEDLSLAIATAYNLASSTIPFISVTYTTGRQLQRLLTAGSSLYISDQDVNVVRAAGHIMAGA